MHALCMAAGVRKAAGELQQTERAEPGSVRTSGTNHRQRGPQSMKWEDLSAKMIEIRTSACKHFRKAPPSHNCLNQHSECSSGSATRPCR
jgi:hypothetical protein